MICFVVDLFCCLIFCDGQTAAIDKEYVVNAGGSVMVYFGWATIVDNVGDVIERSGVFVYVLLLLFGVVVVGYVPGSYVGFGF